jgi:AraC-like DNA-binding protein
VLIAPGTFRRLVRARDLLAADAGEALPIRIIASQVGLSQFHFIRQFAAVFGSTPHQYRTRVRLDRARCLLEAGAPVTETCMEVGFSSLGSFSALFTRWIGASPSRYRSDQHAPRAAEPIVPGCLGLMTGLPARNSREATAP